MVLLPHAWLHRLCARWYRISAEQFDFLSFAGNVLYKVLIITFNIVSYLALLIVGRE